MIAPVACLRGRFYGDAMTDPPETIRISSRRVACDGSGGPDGVPPALGHPRVWLEIDTSGVAECSYCDRRFVLIGGAHDSVPGDIEKPDEDGLGR